jgi:hypothetical protein
MYRRPILCTLYGGVDFLNFTAAAHRQQLGAAFYWHAPSDYIYKSAAHISTTAGGPFFYWTKNMNLCLKFLCLFASRAGALGK